MTKVTRINNAAEIQQLRATILGTTDLAVARLKDLLDGGSPMEVFEKMRFEPVGCDPLDSSRPLNFVEQVNQAFTYLATLEATEWLLQRHPGAAPFVLNLGTASGPDVASADGRLAAEVFAAVSPQNNRKLANDLDRVAKMPATQRFVFFACPGDAQDVAVRNVGGVSVTVVPLRMLQQGFGHAV